MKKIILILSLAIISICLYSQATIPWEGSIDVNWSKDSVIPGYDIGQIAGYSWVATFWTEDLSAPIGLGIGGSLHEAISQLYHFENFDSDSLPYTFDPSNSYLQVITSIDTATQKSFHSGSEPYGFSRPEFEIDPGTDTVFTLNWKFLFAK